MESRRTRRLSVIHSANPYKRPSGRDSAIGVLPDDVLLVVFGFYRVSSPPYWHRLAHVCQRWRRIVFAFPCSLDLRLYCTPKTPVRSTLDCWPAFPIEVRCSGGSQNPKRPSPEEEDNIVAALQLHNRVRSIELRLTSSLIEKLRTQVEESFSELEDLVLLSQNSTQLVLPNTFRWGSRLRSLHSTRVSFTLPQLLSSSPNLVDLQLHDIPRIGYFSPEALVNALSGMAQLQSLSLRFLCPASRQHHVGIPPSSGERVSLPSLTRFKFRGTSNNLDRLAARIAAPSLNDIEIAFFNELTFDVSHLGRFLSRIEIQKSHRRAEIRTSKRTVSICFSQRGAPARLKLEISCRRLDRQLTSMAQICDHFPASFLRVGNLAITTTQPTSGHDSVESEQWLGLLRSFSRAQKVHLAGELATDIVHSLRPTGDDPEPVLPALRNLYLQEPGPLFAPLRAAVVPFVTSRRISGCPITVEYTQRYSKKPSVDI